ncbi:MAG: transcriptional repressor of sporulation and degradative enzyme production [Paenibacillaceae bacterium]|nr:transcriptional repressor of sporulation and degradative enzyme production [Paenibacillaceae bacterium]
MYTPKAFEVTDRQTINDFIRKNSFGILFSHSGSEPMASHLPFLLEDEETGHGLLLGHMAKANPQWRDADNQDVIVVFQGPHTYISPTWYNEANTVPTWNYVAVHAYGKFNVINDKQRVQLIIENTVNFYESAMPNPWSVDLSSAFMEALMGAIVAFEITIHRVEGKWKLSQNHSLERRNKVIAALEDQQSENSDQIAKLMHRTMDRE